MASTIDPLIRLRPSPELKGFISHLRDNHPEEVMPKNLVGCLQGEEGEEEKRGVDLPTVQDIRWVYDRRHLLKDHQGPKHFHELIRDCQMVLPSPQFPPRNPELEARIQKLKLQQAEREYKRMTENVDGRQGLARDSVDQPIGKQMRELNNYLLIIVQLVITVGCSFAFGYFAPYFIRGVTNVGTRLLTGILCAFVVAIADLYFVIKFLLEMEGVIQPDKTKVYEATAPSSKVKAS